MAPKSVKVRIWWLKKRTFRTIKVCMCSFDWAVTCVTLWRTRWEKTALTSGPCVRLWPLGLKRGFAGRDCREQRAALLWCDRITEWLAIHDCQSAGALDVKTRHCSSPQVSERQETLCSRRPDHPLSQNKWKHATFPTPARHAYLLLYGRKNHPT